MANEENYIGIAMGLDVSDLKSGLAEASKRISTANAEFKAASSGMEDWQKSTDGLTAKIKQLDAVYSAQKSKLSGLAAEYEKVAKEQGEGSTAARNLYIRMKNQEAVVNSTEKELKNYKETLKLAEEGTIDLTQVSLKAGKAVKGVGDGLKDAGKDAEDAGGKFGGFAKVVGGGLAAVGGAIAGAVTGFLALAESTREAREDMAKLTSAFAGANLGGDSAKSTFTELYKVIGETDTAVEASQQIALLAKSEEEAAKWAGIATGVTATFGDALKPETFYEAANETLKLGEATGAFTQMLEGTGVNVEEFNAELATMTTEQEKQAYMLKVSEEAMGAAGKAYEETAGSIMDAREAEAELSLAMQELGAIAEPIVTLFKGKLVEALEYLTPLVKQLSEAFTSFFNGDYASGAEIITSIFSDIGSKGVELFNNIVGKVSELLPVVLPKIIELLESLVHKIIEFAPTLLDGAIKLLYSLVEAIPPTLTSLLQALPSIISGLLGFFMENYPKIIKAGYELLLNLIAGIIDCIPDLVGAAGDIVGSIIDTIMETDWLAVGEDILQGILDGLLNIGSSIWDTVTEVGSKIKKGFTDFFGIHSPSRLMKDEVGQYLGLGIGEGLVDSIPQVKRQLSKFSNFVTDNLGGIKTGLSIDANLNSLSRTGARVGGGISSVQNIYFNGNLSRKELKRIENDNYKIMVGKMKAGGLV